MNIKGFDKIVDDEEQTIYIRKGTINAFGEKDHMHGVINVYHDSTMSIFRMSLESFVAQAGLEGE